jgi:DnaJ family protein C protein 7
VLSDPRRRERYDMGEDEDGLNDGGPGGFPGGGVHFADLFAQFGGDGPFPGARMHSHQGFYFHG